MKKEVEGKKFNSNETIKEYIANSYIKKILSMNLTLKSNNVKKLNLPNPFCSKSQTS